MRGLRNFQPGRLYGITQRGNKGQWVCRDEEDFARSFELMRKYTARYGVKVHGWCLLHNHGHWIFEASDAESISNAMRDMQGQFSRYLNQKYRGAPWLLFGSLGGSRRRKRGWTRYLRAGPTNWSPRFDAQLLSDLGFKSFLRYVELNPVRAKLVGSAERWAWSSARAHVTGFDPTGVLCFEQFTRWSLDWGAFLRAPIEAEKAAVTWERVRSGSVWNRPAWDLLVAKEVAGRAVG